MTPVTIKTLMVATSYPADLTDWKGLFIRHLADALANRTDISLNLWAPPGQTHPDVQVATNDNESRFLTELLREGGIAHIIRKKNVKSLTTPLQLLSRLGSAYRRANVDIYHVNWLQNALPIPNDNRPVLVSVLGTDMQLLKLPAVIPSLRRVFKKHPTIICPNADWMVPLLREAFSDVARVQFIPFGIDPIWYQIERNPPGHVPDPKIWLAVTRLTKAKVGPLFDWGSELFKNGQRELHLFGPMQETMNIPDWVHYHGAVGPDELATKWFPKAHGLITLSRHAEGRPQVMLEAMASGLPIVASRLPAHEGVIRHGETGWICDTPEDVIRGVRQFEEPDLNRAAGATARQWAADTVGTWDDCAQRYVDQYRMLLTMDEGADS